MSYKGRFNPLVFIALLVGIALACRRTPTSLPPTPVPPVYLHTLPTWARIECPDEEHLRAIIVLWQHAEWPPHDESSKIGNRGAEIGEVQSCEPVEVLDYEWASFKQEFWVLVDNHDGQRGWLAASYIEFEPS